MEKTNNASQGEGKEMTKEEYKAYVTKRTEFFDTETPVLEKELAYQKLRSEIEEQKAKELLHIRQQASIMAPQLPETDEPEKPVEAPKDAPIPVEKPKDSSKQD